MVVAIQSNSENAADAMDEASAVTAAMLATLENENIPTADIQTGVIRLSPQYLQSVLSSGNEIVGYRAVNSIQVRVTNLDRLGSLLAGVVGGGANRLDRIDFGLIDPTEAMDVARQRAVAETIRQAGVYADAAGVTVGDVMQLSVGNASGYRPIMMDVAAEGMMTASAPSFDVPIEPRIIDLSASVTMVFEIGTP